MTIGTLMEIENSQIRGQVPRDSIFLEEKPPDGYTWSGRTDKKTNDLQTRHFVARDLERYV